MTHRTCDHPGCNKPHRARGLCATHYNQKHAPNRHKKKLVECVICGVTVERWGGGGRKLGSVCSTACRTRAAAMLRGEKPELPPDHSELPPDHWARWYGKASAWPRYGLLECKWCRATFAARVSHQRCCSPQCTARARKGVKTPLDKLASTPRRCTRCGGEYLSAYIARVHCSDLCRDLDADDRGATLHHGWIRPAIRAAIYARDGYQCKLCGEPVDTAADPQRDDWAPTLDHIIPRSKGGTHDVSNLRTAHRWCNSVRGDRDDAELFEPTA